LGGAAALLSLDSLIAFTPSVPLLYDTDYTLTIGPDIFDVSGNPRSRSSVRDSATIPPRTTSPSPETTP
jgi:hypothetical protein